MTRITKTGSALAIVIFCFLCLSPFPDSVSAETTKKEKAKKCEKPKQFADDLDIGWVMGHGKWYFPMMSKQDLIRQSSDILKKTLKEVSSPSSSILDGINSKACLEARWDGLKAIISGFSGKESSYELSPDWLNFNIIAFEKAWKKGQSGTLYSTHSDNENYVIFVRCWEDQQRTWMVMTTKEMPSEKLKTKILQQIKSLGFSEDDLELLDYDQCNAVNEKSEL